VDSSITLWRNPLEKGWTYVNIVKLEKEVSNAL